ncbi:energy transducer TonB [Pseudoalteromonas spongiae]|uniref:Energy transducer TonB n=1 Tax=Pseudoalteromonas spongiae TaxID=298657 RepID=A0ABU8EY97_9GAMM
MKKVTSHSIAMLVAFAILTSALSLVMLSRFLTTGVQKSLTVRNIETMSLPPPPPPPPPMTQPQVDTPTIAISASGEGPQITMSLVKPEVTYTQQPIDITFQVDDINWSDSLDVDWQAFGLSDLDSLPRSLANLKFNVPKKIRRSGVKRFDIVLDVLINEQGKVTLIDIKENPFPSFKKEIKRIVKIARFTPPKKNGENVKARFNWPIEVETI